MGIHITTGMEAVLKPHAYDRCPECNESLDGKADDQWCFFCQTDLYKTNPRCRDCGQRKDAESKLATLQKRVVGYMKAARLG